MKIKVCLVVLMCMAGRHGLAVALEAPTHFWVDETYGDELSPTGSFSTYLKWTDNSLDEEGFKVEVSLDGVTYTTLSTVEANDTTDFPRMPAGQIGPFHLRVRAFKGTEYSDPSNGLEFVTLNNPYPFVTYSPNATSARLQWRDLSNAETGYVIERSQDGGATFTEVMKQPSANYYRLPDSGVVNYYLYTDDNRGAGLPADTTFIYRIRGYCAIGNSPFSEPPFLTIAPGIIPNAPTNLTPTLTPTRVRLYFMDQSNNEQQFCFERSTDHTNWTAFPSCLNTVPVNRKYYSSEVEPASRYIDDAAVFEPGRTYYYRCYAKNGIGNSPYAYADKNLTIPAVPPAGVTAWYVWEGATGQTSGESWTNAWRNIREINWAVIKAGHTLYISGDTYDETLDIYSGGIPGSPVIIRTGAAAPHPTGHENKVILPDIKIRVPWVTIDGSLNGDFEPFTAEDTSNINMEVRNSPSTGILGGGNIAGVSVRFVRVHTTGADGINFNGAPLDKVEIYGCHVLYAQGAGIFAGGSLPPAPSFDSHKIQKCLVEYSADDIIQTAGHCTISDNILRYNYPNLSKGHPDGIQMVGANYFKIYNNRMYDRTGSSYFLVNASDKSGTFRDWFVYNNVFYYSDKSLAVGTAGIYYSGRNINEPGLAFVPEVTFENVLIANNTFVNMVRSSVIGFGRREEETGKVILRNCTIANNLIFDCAPATFGAAIHLEDSDTPGIVFDQNTFSFRNNLVAGQNNRIYAPDRAIYTAEAINALPGFSANSSLAPQFVNFSASDFQLTEADPAARNKGANLTSWNLSGLERDIAGNARGADGAWDIGAYEFCTENCAELPPSSADLLSHANFMDFKNVFNPVKGETLSILYRVSKDTAVELAIYSRKGHRIQKMQGLGWIDTDNIFIWDGRNEKGEIVSSGVYLLQLLTPGGNDKKKVVVVK